MPGSPFFFVKTNRAASARDVSLEGQASSISAVKVPAPSSQSDKSSSTALSSSFKSEDLKAEASSTSERVASADSSFSASHHLPVGLPPVGGVPGCCDFQPVLYVKQQPGLVLGHQATHVSAQYTAAGTNGGHSSGGVSDFQGHQPDSQPAGSDLDHGATQIIHGTPIENERPQLPHQLLQAAVQVADQEASQTTGGHHDVAPPLAFAGHHADLLAQAVEAHPNGLLDVLNKLPGLSPQLLAGNGGDVMSLLSGLGGHGLPNNIQHLIHEVRTTGNIPSNIPPEIAHMVSNVIGVHSPNQGKRGDGGGDNEKANPGPTAAPFFPRRDKNIFTWYPRQPTTPATPHKPLYNDGEPKPHKHGHRVEELVHQGGHHVIGDVVGPAPVHVAVVQGPVLEGETVHLPPPGPVQVVHGVGGHDVGGHEFGGHGGHVHQELVEAEIVHSDTQRNIVTARPQSGSQEESAEHQQQHGAEHGNQHDKHGIQHDDYQSHHGQHQSQQDKQHENQKFQHGLQNGNHPAQQDFQRGDHQPQQGLQHENYQSHIGSQHNAHESQQDIQYGNHQHLQGLQHENHQHQQGSAQSQHGLHHGGHQSQHGLQHGRHQLQHALQHGHPMHNTDLESEHALNHGNNQRQRLQHAGQSQHALQHGPQPHHGLRQGPHQPHHAFHISDQHAQHSLHRPHVFHPQQLPVHHRPPPVHQGVPHPPPVQGAHRIRFPQIQDHLINAEVVRGRPQGDYDPRQPPRIHVEDVPAEVLATGIHPNGHPIRVDGINLNIIAPSPVETQQHPPPEDKYNYYHRPEDVPGNAQGKDEHQAEGQQEQSSSQIEYHEAHSQTDQDKDLTSDDYQDQDYVTELSEDTAENGSTEPPQAEGSSEEKSGQRGAIHFHPIQTEKVKEAEPPAQLYHAYYAPAQHKPPPGYVRMTVDEFNKLFKDAEIQFIGSETDLNKKLEGKNPTTKLQVTQKDDRDTQESAVKVETVPQGEDKKTAIRTSVSVSTSTSIGDKIGYPEIQPRDANKDLDLEPQDESADSTEKPSKATKKPDPESKDNVKSVPNLFGARLKTPRKLRQHLTS